VTEEVSGSQVFWSENPASPNVMQADHEKGGAEEEEQCEIGQQGHYVLGVEGAVENVGAVREWKHVREGPEKYRELLNREEEPAKENHREAEEVGKGLGLEDLAH